MWTHLVHGIARQNDPAVMPVLQDALFECNHTGAGSALPDLGEDDIVGDGLVHDELGERVDIGVGVALPPRPSVRLVPAEDDKEVDGVWLGRG